MHHSLRDAITGCNLEQYVNVCICRPLAINPSTCYPLQATPELLAHMRGACAANSSALEAASAAAVANLLKPRPPDGGKLRRGKASPAAAADVLAAHLAKARRHLLPSTCPLVGRKVAADAMVQWAELLRPVMTPSW